jgi:hypothetical protein
MSGPEGRLKTIREVAADLGHCPQSLAVLAVACEVPYTLDGLRRHMYDAEGQARLREACHLMAVRRRRLRAEARRRVLEPRWDANALPG